MFGIRTHDPNLAEIYLIKTQISSYFPKKGRGGAESSSIPRGTLKPLLLVIESPCLRIFAKKCYDTLKTVKNLIKRVQKQNAPVRI